jgi:Na+-driven multidrug efflux pump
MQIPELTEDIVLMLPIIFLVQSIVALVLWFAFGSRGGRGARFAAWLGLVTLTLWVGSGLAFVALHVLLFSFGNTAVIAGVVVTTVFMLLMPFGWWYVVRNRGAGQPGGTTTDSTPTPAGSQPR